MPENILTSLLTLLRSNLFVAINPGRCFGPVGASFHPYATLDQKIRTNISLRTKPQIPATAPGILVEMNGCDDVLPAREYI
jgi:hypothetical protein